MSEDNMREIGSLLKKQVDIDKKLKAVEKDRPSASEPLIEEWNVNEEVLSTMLANSMPYHTYAIALYSKKLHGLTWALLVVTAMLAILTSVLLLKAV